VIGKIDQVENSQQGRNAGGINSGHSVKLLLTGLQTQFPRKLPAGHAGTFPNLQTEKRYCLNPRRLGAGPVLISL